MITLAKLSNKRLLQYLISGIAIALASMPTLTLANQLSISNTPLFITIAVPPNVILSLDNSLSMSHAHVPDSLGDNTSGNNILSQRRYKSNYYNAVYYSPFITYPIPTRNDGTTYATTFGNAFVNGFDSTKGAINLSTSYSVTFFYKTNVNVTTYNSTTNCPFQTATAIGNPIGGWINNECMRARNPSVDYATTQTSPVAAYYYIFWSQKTGQSLPTNCTGSAVEQKEDEDCYVKIVVGSTTAPLDLFVGTVAQQQQNFANWFSFYRNRALMLMSTATTAVSSFDTNEIRLAWQTVNTSGSKGTCTLFGTDCQGTTTASSENRMRPLDALKTGSTTITHRKDFFDWIKNFDISGSTPLRNVLKKAGEYYKLSGRDSPYAADPYTTVGTELTCRKNYQVMFTDGLWNSDDRVDFNGNVDSTSTVMPDNSTYVPQFPYKNTTTPGVGLSYSNSLADIAFDYWKTDLRLNFSNNLIPNIVDTTGTETYQYWNPKNDPATWQHMVNFNIGLGLSSTLTDPIWAGSTYTGDYAALGGNPNFTATKYWPAIDETPTIGAEPVGHAYDLWHAAINSRGQFFSVEEPNALQNAFKTTFSSILSANASSTAAATNSTSIKDSTVLYQAQFSSRDWSGHLFRFPVSSTGLVIDTNNDGKLNGSDANWDSATLIPISTSRKILTFNDVTKGTYFVWANLSTSQQTSLVTQDNLNWLRGDASKEARNGGTLRNRKTTVLGDIINSDPAYSYNEDFGYATLPSPEGKEYNNFVPGKSTRPPMVYEGANDGMLHAFRADLGNSLSGSEYFAYIPAAVYPNLQSLTTTTYAHKYFVDGSPTVGDAYLGTTTTKSWKTVLLGGLGNGGKAIYALDISTPQSFASTQVLWEYSGSTATATDGTNVTDANGLGFTYSQPQIARLKNGTWVAIFGNGYNSTSERAFLYIVDLNTGSLIRKIPTDLSTSNGLSTPRLYSSSGDKIIDFVYAGDLLGRMWKFDLSNTSPSLWGLGNNNNPIFNATSTQPITTQPTLASVTNGVMIYFGTGRYLTGTDPIDTATQSFYALLDKTGATTTIPIGNLVQQTITLSSTYRLLSANTVDYVTKLGWYINFSGGERILSPALLKDDRIIFLTVIPSSDPCSPGGDSWIMEVNSLTGGATAISAFDINGDNMFDDKDKISNSNIAGVKSTAGMLKNPVWLESFKGGAVKELSGSSGNIMTLKNRSLIIPGTVKRLSWQQLQ